jgi:hypothetical protein
MSFVSNGGKFKLYTVPKILFFSPPTQPKFSFEGMIYWMKCSIIKKMYGNEKD